MVSMNLFTISIAIIIFVFAQAKDHPTLPTQWTAITIEPGAGEGQESYNFVAEPSTDKPSSMWSKYKGCQRLIHVDNYSGGTRYLLGCESVKCCTETQSGNQVEFQIPNVQYSDPTREVEITYTGNVTITNFDEKMVADEWAWSVQTHSGSVIGDYKAYTVDCSGQGCPTGVQLLQWQARAFGSPWYTIQFKDYKGIDPSESAAFEETFAIPEECQGNILSCSNDD